MITDLTLIKVLCTDKPTAYKYRPFIKPYALTDEGKVLFKDVFDYYESFDSIDYIDINRFATWFHQLQHPDYNEEKHELYTELFKRLDKEKIDTEDAFYKEIVKHYKKEEVKFKIEQALDKNKFNSAKIAKYVQQYDKDVDLIEEQDYTFNAFNDIFVKTTRAHGLRWRLSGLNKSIGPLIPGDFGIIAAYVDTGKSKFVASEASHMAQQLKEGSVLWFNNEGPEDRVLMQLWCATLKATPEDIKRYPDQAEKKYTEKMNGDKDRIKVFDAIGFTVDDIRAKAEKYNAKLIIIDMLDHFTASSKKTDAEVIRLKNLYRDIRDVSKDFCPVLGTSQCDGSVVWKDKFTQEASFQEFIGMHQLDYSRSAKQAAAEFIITIGRNPEYPSTRAIHVPKNKLPGDGTGAYRNIKERVVFDGDRSLYTDSES